LLTSQEGKGWRTTVARLKLISGVQAQAKWRVILKAALGQPINSRWHLTFECGSCGAVVLEHVNLEQIRGCAVECGCGALNQTAR